RGRFQHESMRYEQRKHDGSLPIVGVNTFRGRDDAAAHGPLELARGTEAERRSQLDRVRAFQDENAEESHRALARLAEVAHTDGNIFDVLMDAARVCTLQQVTDTFFAVGGQYRRTV
ncbi:methylmalonyl-CoA mutase family protein, partial [Nocardia sp. NPDC058497]|uniref:methylmalonyl-CoA mutase family protein n=1 Tax=Nocardia sp. NPDC058497 TaxID=3346529 RepID=UPI00364A60C6